MQSVSIHVFGVEKSLSGKAWRWRGGNMDLTAEQGDSSHSHSPSSLDNDIITQLLMTRGVAPEDVERHRKPALRDFLPDPSYFRDMDIAAQRIAQAVLNGESVTIYGDYDVDGATSAALFIRLLRDLGLEANYYIPDRLLEGYGPSGKALVELAAQGSTLIITVDCGAMAHDALQQANDAGVDVIVVDHHKCSHDLPITTALVNPNRLDETDEAAEHGNLAAVGVAFLACIAVVRNLRHIGYFKDKNEPNLLSLLDLVALGTVADVAALRGLNRAFVAQGLKVMAHRENIGMAALIDASRINRAPSCSDLGFALGPRINAGGRVGESTLGVRLLTTQDPEEARVIAQQLSVLNEERREIEAQVQSEAEAQIAQQHNRAVMVLCGRGWHPGVIGIVAGRIKEKTGKPTIVIALEEDSASETSCTGKGSGRSITGVDLGAEILAAREQGLLITGGGHAMAAGLSIAADKVQAFSDWLDMRLGAQVAQAMAGQSLSLDLAVTPRGLQPDLVTTLESAGPYGMGWPSPRIAVGPLRLVKADVVGNQHLRLIVRGKDGASFKAMAFRAAESDMGQALLYGAQDRAFWLVGRPKIDDWSSRAQAELHIDDAAWAD